MLKRIKHILQVVILPQGTKRVGGGFKTIRYDFHQKIQRTDSQGMDLARMWNCPFIETSAFTGDNIIDLFQLLLKETRLLRGRRDASSHKVMNPLYGKQLPKKISLVRSIKRSSLIVKKHSSGSNTPEKGK